MEKLVGYCARLSKYLNNKNSHSYLYCEYETFEEANRAFLELDNKPSLFFNKKVLHCTWGVSSDYSQNVRVENLKIYKSEINEMDGLKILYKDLSFINFEDILKVF